MSPKLVSDVTKFPENEWRTYYVVKNENIVSLEVETAQEALSVLEKLYLPEVFEDFIIKVSTVNADGSDGEQIYEYDVTKQQPELPFLKEYEYTLKFEVSIHGEKKTAKFFYANGILWDKKKEIPFPTYMNIYDNDLSALDVLSVIFPTALVFQEQLKDKKEIFVSAVPRIVADSEEILETVDDSTKLAFEK